jgi:hypothetical protein
MKTFGGNYEFGVNLNKICNNFALFIFINNDFALFRTHIVFKFTSIPNPNYVTYTAVPYFFIFHFSDMHVLKLMKAQIRVTCSYLHEKIKKLMTSIVYILGKIISNALYLIYL